MPKSVPPPNSLALTLLREGAGWTQKELAAAAGVTPGVVSFYEQGFRPLHRERLQKLAALMGYDESDVEVALLGVAAIVRPEVPQLGEREESGDKPPAPDASAPGLAAGRPRRRAAPTRRPPERAENAPAPGAGTAPAEPAAAPPLVAPAAASPAEPSPFELRLAREAAARLGLAMARLAEPQVSERLRAWRVAAARALAARLWKEMKGFSGHERRMLVEWLEEFRGWAVAERLAAESARAAPRSAAAAVELARLALRVAELAEVAAGFRRRLQGFARAFLANALRVEGRLREAEAEMAAAWALWRSGEDPDAILREWRLHDLEASLRKDQGRYTEALALIERARAAAPEEAVGRILVSKGFILEQAGDVAGAVAALGEAAPLVEAAGTLRDRFGLSFNLTVNLCHLGGFAAAREKLPDLRQLAQALGNGLDLLKVEWLSGRVAAGLGQREEARRTFELVRDHYAALRNTLRTAMLSLELAVLYLEEGRTAEVRTLAESMLRIFLREGDQSEALMAVRLFQEAAQRETATVEEARRLMAVLEKTPGLNSKT